MTASAYHGRATIADVARRARVSIATVSRVINDTTQVSEDLAVRVRAAAADLHYRPHTAARNLASRTTNALGLLLPGISDEFFSPMLRGIEAATTEAGYHLLISASSPTASNGDRLLGEHNTDGLLIFTDSLDDAELRRLRRIRFPMVVLYRSAPAGLDIPSVMFENKQGARQIVDHLIEVHGHRRIAFLSGPVGNEDADWREQGYRESLAAHHLPYDPARVALGGFDDGRAQTSVEAWLRAGTQFDALFAADDESAMGALEALRLAGRRVPEDVAVVGFDDVPSSRHLTPPLTTVRAPIEQAGGEAARQLVRLIRSGRAEPKILLPTELVIRRSCGCR